MQWLVDSRGRRCQAKVITFCDHLRGLLSTEAAIMAPYPLKATGKTLEYYTFSRWSQIVTSSLFFDSLNVNAKCADIKKPCNMCGAEVSGEGAGSA